MKNVQERLSSLRPLVDELSAFCGGVMSKRVAFQGSMVALLLVGTVLADEGLKSGPQPGDGVGVYQPLHVTGRFAGQKQCPV
jgi:hypothetical protein